MSPTPACLGTLAQKINQELGVSVGVTLDQPCIDEFANCTSTRVRVKLVGVDDKGQGRQLITTENTVEIEGGDKPTLIANTRVMAMSS